MWEIKFVYGGGDIRWKQDIEQFKHSMYRVSLVPILITGG